jgi:hypothetical protein
MAIEKKDPFASTTVTSKTIDIPLTSENGVPRVPPANADPGDTLRWTVGNRPVSIWFPTAGVFPSTVLAATKRGDIEVVVPRTARPGTYEYMIFCHDTDQYAVCNSHPILVIPIPN